MGSKGRALRLPCASPTPRTLTGDTLTRGTLVHSIRRGLTLASALLALLLPPAGGARAASLAETVMAQLAAQPDRTARFTEEKRLSSLTRPLLSSGSLFFTRPSRLEQDTEQPKPERLVIDGDSLTVTEGNGPSRTIPLDEDPGLRALADTLRAALAGDLPTLQRIFAIEEQGAPGAWRLLLVPRDAALRGELARVTLDGSGGTIRQITIQQRNGDEQRLAISPA